MTLRFRLPLIALAFAATSAHAQSAQDFQLPPRPTPTANPDVQGPVDTEGAVPIRPRVIPTPTPTSSEEQQQTSQPPRVQPSASPPTEQVQPQAIPAAPRGSTQTPAVPPPQSSVQPATRTDTAPPSALPLPIDDGIPDAVPQIATPPVAIPSDVPSLVPETTEGGGFGWLGIFAALGLAALGGVFALRRRKANGAVPQIERPMPDMAGAHADRALNLRVEALKLSRSVMNATLFYRVTVLNRSQAPLSQISVEADLTSASGTEPMEQQVAGPATALERRHERERLAAGQSARFEGQIVLPLAQAQMLRQGRVALLVPLLKLRATAAGVDPVAKTLAIGPAASGGGDRLVPFRLDEGPRSYEPLAQKAIA